MLAKDRMKNNEESKNNNYYDFSINNYINMGRKIVTSMPCITQSHLDFLNAVNELNNTMDKWWIKKFVR